jgi:hypothetical protein
MHQLSGSTINGAVYTLDAAGNRATKADDLAGVTSNYTYDKIYELTQVMQGLNTTESYSYDPTLTGKKKKNILDTNRPSHGRTYCPRLEVRMDLLFPFL